MHADVSALRSCTGLTALDLSMNRLASPALAPVAAALPRLRRLDVSGCDVGDLGVLAPLAASLEVRPQRQHGLAAAAA